MRWDQLSGPGAAEGRAETGLLFRNLIKIAIIWIDTRKTGFLNPILWIDTKTSGFLNSIIWIDTKKSGFLNPTLWIDTRILKRVS